MSGRCLDFVPIWTLILGVGRVPLRAARRLRPRRRHPLRLRARPRRAQSVMNSIAPIWDGNETWLVLGGVGAARGLSARLRDHHAGGLFPDPRHAAGARLPRRRVRVPLPRRRAPNVLGPRLLLRLGARRPSRRAWCSAPSSRAFETDGRHFAGGSLDCFTPFSLLTGLALVFGYALLGAGWLILKTEGAAAGLGAPAWGASRFAGVLDRHRASSACGRRCAAAASPQRWFSWPNIAFLAPVPIVTALRRLARMARAQQPFRSRALHRRHRACS